MRPVIFIAPFPLETTMRFARAAAHLPGVRLLGVLQQAPRATDKHLFSDVILVKDGLSTRDLIAAVAVLKKRHGQPHRLIGVLEPLQVQIAQVRAHFGIEGTDVDTADLFRDKARMKDRLRAAGLPCARHALLHNADDGRTFAKDVGFPMVLKPPAGMGAKATFRVHHLEALLGALAAMGTSATSPLLAEEFLRGQEGSFDTLTVDNRPRISSISHYRPAVLDVIENPWVKWCCLLPQVVTGDGYDDVHQLGTDAISALGLKDGFTHMEWFRRTDGSLAIGEVAQRPPGANITQMIGLCHDQDAYRAWALAVVDGVVEPGWQRKYAVGCAYFRGIGHGRIRSVEGVDAANKAVGHLVVDAKLPKIGQAKSDSYEGDGFAILRDTNTNVVQAGLRTLIENVQVHYA